MRVITFFFTFTLFIISSLASPLQLGYGKHVFLQNLSFNLRFLSVTLHRIDSNFCFSGGVYNSPEANAYWARRFGGVFGENLSGLAALQANIDAQAYSNRGHSP